MKDTLRSLIKLAVPVILKKWHNKEEKERLINKIQSFLRSWIHESFREARIDASLKKFIKEFKINEDQAQTLKGYIYTVWQNSRSSNSAAFSAILEFINNLSTELEAEVVEDINHQSSYLVSQQKEYIANRDQFIERELMKGCYGSFIPPEMDARASEGCREMLIFCENPDYSKDSPGEFPIIYFQVPAPGILFYLEKGWNPPDLLVRALMSAKQVYVRNDGGKSPGGYTIINIDQNAFEKIKANTCGARPVYMASLSVAGSNGLLPAAGIICGYVFGVRCGDAQGPLFQVESYGMETELRQGDAQLTPFGGSILYQGKNVKDQFLKLMKSLVDIPPSEEKDIIFYVDKSQSENIFVKTGEEKAFPATLLTPEEQIKPLLLDETGVEGYQNKLKVRVAESLQQLTNATDYTILQALDGAIFKDVKPDTIVIKFAFEDLEKLVHGRTLLRDKIGNLFTIDHRQRVIIIKVEKTVNILEIEEAIGKQGMVVEAKTAQAGLCLRYADTAALEQAIRFLCSNELIAPTNITLHKRAIYLTGDVDTKQLRALSAGLEKPSSNENRSHSLFFKRVDVSGENRPVTETTPNFAALSLLIEAAFTKLIPHSLKFTITTEHIKNQYAPEHDNMRLAVEFENPDREKTLENYIRFKAILLLIGRMLYYRDIDFDFYWQNYFFSNQSFSSLPSQNFHRIPAVVWRLQDTEAIYGLLAQIPDHEGSLFFSLRTMFEALDIAANPDETNERSLVAFKNPTGLSVSLLEQIKRVNKETDEQLMAQAIQQENDVIVEKLLQEKRVDPTVYLYTAIKCENELAVYLLLKYGANPNGLPNRSPKPIQLAAKVRKENIDILYRLLECKGLILETGDVNESPLFEACRYGCWQAIGLLLKNDIYRKNINDIPENILHILKESFYANRFNNPDVSDTLMSLELFAALPVFEEICKDTERYKDLFWRALEKGVQPAVKFLLEKMPALLQLKTQTGANCLKYCAAQVSELLKNLQYAHERLELFSGHSSWTNRINELNGQLNGLAHTIAFLLEKRSDWNTQCLTDLFSNAKSSDYKPAIREVFNAMFTDLIKRYTVVSSIELKK